MRSEGEFLDFLSGDRPPAEDDWSERGVVWIFLLAILGGLALNLTPCVLPMVPVNLMVIGASPGRGLLYGLGQMCAFGALGLLAALGGVAFGTVQSSPWFNGAVACLLLVFALALLDVFSLDFSRFRKGLKGGAFVLGAISAVLAGACIAPILASVLVLTARFHAEGCAWALLLPFAVGFGLALPWPFLGAGLKVLPKPGAWMKFVNWLFAVFILILSAHYAHMAVRAVVPAHAPATDDLTVQKLLESGRLTAPRARPLLVVCHASWCKNCAALDRLFATSPRLRKVLGGFELVRLDVEDPNDLARLPGFETVQGLPACAIYPATAPRAAELFVSTLKQ